MAKSKQNQFRTAMSRGKLVNIKLLVNDPDVDPTENDNHCITKCLHNPEIFFTLVDSGRVDPFQNFERNIDIVCSGITNAPEQDKTIFEFYFQHEDFKKYSLSALYPLASSRNIDMFEKIYNIADTNNLITDKSYSKLMEFASIYNNDEIVDFLLSKKEFNIEPETNALFRIASCNEESIINKMLKDDRFNFNYHSKYIMSELLESKKFKEAIIYLDKIKLKKEESSEVLYKLMQTTRKVIFTTSALDLANGDIDKKREELMPLLKKILLNKYFKESLEQSKKENSEVYQMFHNLIDKALLKNKVEEF